MSARSASLLNVELSLLLSAFFIFSMRIADVSIGTVRIVMLVRGKRLLAGILSFLESFVWLLAAAQVLTDLDDPVKMVAYASGYAAGTMLGASVERWIAMGKCMMRIVVPSHSPDVAYLLRERGYYATVLNAEGRDGGVRIVFSVIKRRYIKELLALVHEANPKAFVTFEEVSVSTVKEPQFRRKAVRV